MAKSGAPHGNCLTNHVEWSLSVHLRSLKNFIYINITMDEKKAVIVGISGASSSGKTTLARLLRDIFPNSFILHQDDFYKPETE